MKINNCIVYLSYLSSQIALTGYQFLVYTVTDRDIFLLVSVWYLTCVESWYETVTV